MHQIMSKSGVRGLWVVLSLPLRFVDADEFFPAPRIFPEAIVGNAIKPGGETRLAAETADVLVSAQERLLREIIRERDIRSGELAQQAPHRRLMPSHQFRERVVIVIEKDSGDELCIGQLHAPRLG